MKYKPLAILLLALALFPLTAHAARHRVRHALPDRGVYSVTINNTQKMPISCTAIAPPNPVTGYPVSWWPNTAPVITSDTPNVAIAPIQGSTAFQVWAIPVPGFVGTANITCAYKNPDGKVALPSSGQIVVAGAPAPTPEPSPSASPVPTAQPSAKPSPDITGTGLSFCGPTGCNPVAQ